MVEERDGPGRLAVALIGKRPSGKPQTIGHDESAAIVDTLAELTYNLATVASTLSRMARLRLSFRSYREPNR